MDDFPINGFDNKVSRSPSSPNKAVLSVKLDFVKKTISKNVLFCLIGFTDASLENDRFMQLPIVVPYRANRVNLIDLLDSREVAHIEAMFPLCDCQSVIGVALWKHKQLLSGCLCDIASRFGNGDRQLGA